MLQNTSDNNSKKIIHIETLGCRLNQIESESVASFFSNDGYSVVMKSITSNTPENKDVILAVVNTCTVTAKAEQKARRIIRLLLKKYPCSIVVVTGCYAQVNQEEISAIDQRIVVLPGRVKSRLSEVPQIVSKLLEENNDNPQVIQTEIKNHLTKTILLRPVGNVSENPFKLSTDTFLHHSRSSIKIQDGCNNRCTYCEICIARGKSVSLSVEEILERVQRLIKQGQKEIVITTVNIAQYKGAYKDTEVDFAGLLEVLLRETEGVAFRFSSLYPQIVDDRLCKLIKDERVRPHFHLSVQSGSDDILKKMARPYEAQVVLDACRRLKAVKENPFLACDIIAGFPTETDDDFEKTMELVKKCGFTWIHAFPFSPRPNTVAYTMKPKVPESVAGKRVQKLLDYSFESKILYIESLKGKELKAIVEHSHNLEAVKKIAGDKKVIHAVTENFLHCIVEYEGDKVPAPGSEITVVINDALVEEIRKNGELEAVGRVV